MKIVHERPPIYDDIVRRIGVPPPTAIFTWGEILYIPSGRTPSLELLEHEKTHSQQQAAIGGPELWWRRYLENPVFRLGEELVAYRAQYLFACAQGLRRPERRQFARDLANVMASPMYGRVIRRRDALAAIVNG